MKAALIPLEEGNPIVLQKDLVLVGRQEHCDLRIEHKTISKLHCVLVKTDGLVFIRDLGSTNGCRVNGQKVVRSALFANDVLSIANFKYRVLLGGDDMALPAGNVGQGNRRSEVTEIIEAPPRMANLGNGGEANGERRLLADSRADSKSA